MTEVDSTLRLLPFTNRFSVLGFRIPLWIRTVNPRHADKTVTNRWNAVFQCFRRTAQPFGMSFLDLLSKSKKLQSAKLSHIPTMHQSYKRDHAETTDTSNHICGMPAMYPITVSYVVSLVFSTALIRPCLITQILSETAKTSDKSWHTIIRLLPISRILSS